MSDLKDDPVDERSASADNVNTDPLIHLVVENKYEIISWLGSGSSGAVYKAKDGVLERDLAIKILHRHLLEDPSARERFLQESLTVASLNHPNIVRIYSRGQLENGQLYIVMDLLEGETLAELLAREKTLNQDRLFSVFEQLLDGLDYAHKQSVVHRDIKPGNIMLTGHSQNLQVKILDFGIAKNIAESNLTKTATGVRLGSSSYMSPEQCKGSAVDGRSDLYSLACVFYESIVGSPPFSGGSDMEVMYQQLNKSPTRSERMTNIAKSIRAFLSKALQKSPEMRFQTADEMKRALLACKSDELYAPRARAPRLPYLVAALLIMIIAGSAIFQSHSPKKAAIISGEKKLLDSIRNDSDLKRLVLNGEFSFEKKRDLSLKWLTQQPSTSPSEKRALLRAKELLIEFFRSKSEFQDAYDLNKGLLKELEDDKIHLRDSMARAARFALSSGHQEESIELFNRTLALTPNKAEDLCYDCYGGLSNAYLQLRRLDEALRYARKRYAHYKDQPVDPCLFSGNELIQVLLVRKDYREAEKIGLELSAVSRSENFLDSSAYYGNKVLFLQELAECADKLGDWEKAENYHFQTISFCHEIEKHSGLSLGAKKDIRLADLRCRARLAELYRRSKQLNKSIAQFKILANQIRPEDGVEAYTLGRPCLGLSYAMMQHFGKARDEYIAACNDWLLHGNHNEFGISEYECLKGRLSTPMRQLYFLMKEPEQFAKFVDAMLFKLPRSGYERAVWLTELGSLYADRGLYVKACDYFHMAEESISGQSQPDELARQNIRVSRAEQLIIKGDNAQGRVLAEKAIDIFKNFSTCKVELARAMRVKAIALRNEGQPNEALTLQKEAKLVFESSRSADASQESTFDFEMGQTLDLMRKFQDAGITYEKAAKDLEKDQNNYGATVPFCYAYACDAFLKGGSYSDAKRCFKELTSSMDKALAMNGRDPKRCSALQISLVKKMLSNFETRATANGDKASAANAGELRRSL